MIKTQFLKTLLMKAHLLEKEKPFKIIQCKILSYKISMLIILKTSPMMKVWRFASRNTKIAT